MTEKKLTLKEAAKESRMSESWWRQKIFRKEVRYLKIGRRIFIPESTINELVANSVVEPINLRKEGVI